MKHTRRGFAVRAALTSFVLAATVVTAPAAPAAAGTDTTCFRVLHASPDAPLIDVYVQSTRVASSLAYTKFTRTWRLATTSARVRVFAAGSDPNTQAYREAIVNLQIGKCYVIVIGNVYQSLEIFTLEDPPVPPTGQFTVRLAHLAPGTPNLDLVKSDDGTIFIQDVTFKGQKLATLNAGTFPLQVRQTGTPTVLIDLGSITFRSRERQTVYVFGTPAAARAAQAQGAPQFLVVRDQ